MGMSREGREFLGWEKRKRSGLLEGRYLRRRVGLL